MKGIKLVLGLSLATIGVGAVSFGLVSSNNLSLNTANAEAPTNQRRIWIVDNNGDSSDTNWWTSSTMYAYAYNANGNVQTKVENKVLSDYYCGLHYVDITLAGATADLTVRIRVGNEEGPYSEGNNNQSGYVELGSLGGEDVVWLNNGVFYESDQGRNSRNVSKGTAGSSAAQLAVIMSKYNTCSNSPASGYHAYEQIKTNFYDPTKDPARDTTNVYGKTYTIKEDMDAMKERHQANL